MNYAGVMTSISVMSLFLHLLYFRNDTCLSFGNTSSLGSLIVVCTVSILTLFSANVCQSDIKI